jgi:hypothetical protein
MLSSAEPKRCCPAHFSCLSNPQFPRMDTLGSPVFEKTTLLGSSVNKLLSAMVSRFSLL